MLRWFCLKQHLTELRAVTNDLQILHAWPIKCAAQNKPLSAHTVKTQINIIIQTFDFWYV